MNEQQNPFLGNEQQINDSSAPQFAQPQVQSQFVQAEGQSQFAQPQVQSQFVQAEGQPQQSQFAQPQVQSQFVQAEGQPQQSQFAQPQVQSQFVQAEGQPQQFTQENQQMQQIFTPNGFEEPKKSNKKKTLTITALIIAVLILVVGGPIGWVMMSKGASTTSEQGQSVKDVKASSEGNPFQYLNKIAQAKKIDGKFNADGEVTIKSSAETLKAKLGVKSGVIHVERTEGNDTPDEFFNLSGTLSASTDSTDSQVKQAVKMIDGEKFDVSLSGGMVFKMSFMGQTNRQTLYGDNKKQVQALFTVDKENQEAGRELRDFLLKGYQFKTAKNGDTTVLTLNKDDLKAIAQKMEENVKNDEKKFKELYMKSTKEASESVYNSIIDQFLDQKLSEGIEDTVLPNLNEFEYKISYKDSGDRIQEKSELKLDFSVSGMYKAKFNLNAETTYTL